MTQKEKIEILKNCFVDTIWMAIRYAHGRHTFAATIVRDAIKDFKRIFPDWEVKNDITIDSPTHELNGFDLRSDYLDDLFTKNTDQTDK